MGKILRSGLLPRSMELMGISKPSAVAIEAEQALRNLMKICHKPRAEPFTVALRSGPGAKSQRSGHRWQVQTISRSRRCPSTWPGLQSTSGALLTLAMPRSVASRTCGASQQSCAANREVGAFGRKVCRRWHANGLTLSLDLLPICFVEDVSARDVDLANPSLRPRTCSTCFNKR